MSTYSIIDNPSSAKARGKRLKMARKMTGLTRKGLEEKYGISASTVQSWEAVKAGGLTEQGAQRIISVLQSEGFLCSADWLLQGIGSPPEPTNLYFPMVRENAAVYSLPEEVIVEKELTIFQKIHRDVLSLVVNDDGMEPYYNIGDLVAGKCRRTPETINQLIGFDCIVETAAHEILLRRVKPSISGKTSYYNLVCINPNTAVTTPILCEQKLVSAAPVVWHRCRDVQS